MGWILVWHVDGPALGFTVSSKNPSSGPPNGQLFVHPYLQVLFIFPWVRPMNCWIMQPTDIIYMIDLEMKQKAGLAVDECCEVDTSTHLTVTKCSIWGCICTSREFHNREKNCIDRSLAKHLFVHINNQGLHLYWLREDFDMPVDGIRSNN